MEPRCARFAPWLSFAGMSSELLAKQALFVTHSQATARQLS
jgi:hypothetical protein